MVAATSFKNTGKNVNYQANCGSLAMAKLGTVRRWRSGLKTWCSSFWWVKPKWRIWCSFPFLLWKACKHLCQRNTSILCTLQGPHNPWDLFFCCSSHIQMLQLCWPTLSDMDMFQEVINTGNMTGFPCTCWNLAHVQHPPTSESKLLWAQPENWLCSSDLWLLHVGLTPQGQCLGNIFSLSQCSKWLSDWQDKLTQIVQRLYKTCYGSTSKIMPL